MRLAEPLWLLLIVLMPLPWLWQRGRARLSWPTLAGFARAPKGRAGVLRPLPLALRSLAIACLAVALARPQTVGGREYIAGRGVVIVAAIDQSSSMNARDFPSPVGPTLSRLEAAKATFSRFVVGRPDDLIGLVAFANYPDLRCAPTLDHDFLLETVRQLRSARPGEDGTNIGDAIAWSLESLVESPPRKKVLILLTDGQNEPAVPEPLDPELGARLARELGVTLHTIAIGAAGGSSGRPSRSPGWRFPPRSAARIWNCSSAWRNSAGAGPSPPRTRSPWKPFSARSTGWRKAPSAARSARVIASGTPPGSPWPSCC